MKIVIAIDSFKGSLSTYEAASGIQEAALCVFENAETVILPVADGGEGTAKALTEGLGGKMVEAEVTGPLGERITAKYGIVESLAIIEMSEAAGITLVPPEKRDPMNTTTYGVGELILDAIARGCRSFIIGIGGSATNDGGVGMLTALGYRFLDENGTPIERGAKGLRNLRGIDDKAVVPTLGGCDFRIACDVTNPLLGENGCSRIYGPQKGADEASVALMDKYLDNYAKVTKIYSPTADENEAGAGAAGGMGFAFQSFFNAKLERGIELVLETVRLKERLIGADLVITGEGRLDSQTVMGKVPIGVAREAKKLSIPVIAFSGSVTEDAEICNSYGIDAFFPILRRISSLDKAMNKTNAYKNIRDTAKQVFRLIKITKQDR